MYNGKFCLQAKDDELDKLLVKVILFANEVEDNSRQVD